MKFTNDLLSTLLGRQIKSFNVEKGSNPGDNLCSNLFKITAKTEDGNSIGIVYKAFPDDPEIKKYAVKTQLFRRENCFYNSFSPNVTSTLESHLKRIKSNCRNLQRDDTIITQLQLPIPQYFAGFNDDKQDFICIEDLRPVGFKMADKFHGLNYLECSLAIKRLAQFHAISYFYLKHESEDIFQRIGNYKVYLTKQWTISNETEDAVARAAEEEHLKEFITSIYKNSIELIKTYCSSNDKEQLLLRMTGEKDSVIISAYANITKTTLQTDSKYFPLIIHGDLWTNNILFSYSRNKDPVDAKFIDFQFARRGNIYEDLNFLIFTSTTAEFRKQNLTKCLDIYYEVFISTLNLIDFNPPSTFTREQLTGHFYENILPLYLLLSYLIPSHLGKDSEDGKKESEYADELIKKMERSPIALRRWEEATREAVELGII